MMPNQNQNLSMEFLSSSKSKVFKCSAHAANVSKKLQTFYKQKEFFDIAIIAGVDNTKVQAHRLVLSTSSDYFLAMFRSTLMEATADEVEIKEIDGVSLQLIIDFMYTASIELRNEIVENILRAADFFQMQTLITACCDFMGEQLDDSNCLGIAMFAEQHNYLALETKSLAFAHNHFEKVCNGKEFLLLNKAQLTKFISADNRLLRSEEELFLSVVKWIEHDKDREQHIFDLISLLRFKLLNPQFILANSHSICKTIECYELAFGWLKWHSSGKCGDQQKTTKKLSVANLNTNNYCLSMSTYNAAENVWLQNNVSVATHQNRSEKGMIVIDKILVAAGNVRDYYNSNNTYVSCLDLESKTWNDLPQMKQKLNFLSMAELNGELYVFACNSSSTQIMVEKFNFYTRTWKSLASLPTNVQKIKVSALGGMLYLIGEGHPIMQCYDPVRNEWSRRAFIKVTEIFGLAAVREDLYLVGGISNRRKSQTIQRYNPSEDTWTVIDLQVHGDITQCISLNNQLIIYCEEQSTFTEYDPESNKTKIIRGLPQTTGKRYLLTTY